MLRCILTIVVRVVACLLLLGFGLFASRTALAHESKHGRSPTETVLDSDGSALEVEGTLEILHEDREDGSGVYHHWLATHDGKRLSLEGVQHADLLTGDLVRVKGVTSGQKLQLQTRTAEALQVLQFAPLSNTFGPQKMIVFLVNFADNPSYRLYTTDAVKDYVRDEVIGFFTANSYQQTSLVADVVGWYTLPLVNAGCPKEAIAAHASQAAVAAGINLSKYTRRVYLFPQTSCGWSGMGTVGGNPSSAWLNGNLSLFTHELGHNFGLYHSRALSCAPEILGPNCTVSEYGDHTDAMGGGGHFNPFQKQRLGWLDYDESPPIKKVQQSGTYTIEAYDVPGTTPKALKIQRGPTAQAFFVSFRRLVRFESAAGVFVHLATDGSPNSSYLLDMTPEGPKLQSDGHLAVGKSFTDPISGITIQTVSVSATSATISVDLDGTAPPCTRSAPSITSSPAQSPAVQPGTQVTYQVSVKNTDAAGCPASSFTLQATTPTGWQKSFGAPNVTLNPGATASTTLKVASPAVTAGSYTIVGTATSTMASTFSASAAVIYTVASSGGGSGGGTPGTFADRFDRPDSTELGNGWSVVSGGLGIQSGEGRNLANSKFSLAVQPGLTGATQMVEGTFASTNNNSAPRFGVVVRYRDPQNYYICYRQVGGSSVVRVAKVQKGVETVLKSAGVGNPSVNALSTLSCQVAGNTLTLRVDGVSKLTATDSAFTTGSAGFAISSQKAGSHRADNFSAIVQ